MRPEVCDAADRREVARVELVEDARHRPDAAGEPGVSVRERVVEIGEAFFDGGEVARVEGVC